MSEQQLLAWGRKVSPEFRAEVINMCDKLLIPDPSWLMACMAFETGETFAADIRNAAGSGATGLIQFMPNTAVGLGTTTSALARMRAEDQLDYVYRYFKPFRGRINSLADCYMAILLPKYVGKPDDSILFNFGTVAYRQNSGLDQNRDGQVTKAEASAKVLAKLNRGLQPEFAWPL